MFIIIFFSSLSQAQQWQWAKKIDHPFIAKLNISSVVGLNEVASEHNYSSVFPNLSSGVYTLQLEQKSEGIIKVYDVLGKCIFNQRCKNQNDTQIDLSSHPPGVYFVEITNDQNSVRKKIIKN